MTFFLKKHPLFILLMLIKISCHECPSNGCANCGPFLHSTALIFSHDLHSNGAFPLHSFSCLILTQLYLALVVFHTTKVPRQNGWGQSEEAQKPLEFMLCHYIRTTVISTTCELSLFFFSNQWTALCWCRFFDSTGTRCHRLMGKLLKWEELNR